MTWLSIINKLWQGLLLIILIGCSRHVITTASLLEEMSDRNRITYYPEPEYKLKQASSYNRMSVAEGNDDWFANNDMSHFIRIDSINGRREFVMLDTEGPGAIVRWWMTFYKAQNGYIRVYLDYDNEPILSGMPRELLSGESITGYPYAVSLQKGAPIGEEGRDYDHNFYMPIPFSKHCKITYECDSLVMLYEYEGKPVPQGYYWPDVFYNICWRDYEDGTKVESFTPASYKNSKIISDNSRDLLVNAPENNGEYENFKSTMAPHDSFSLTINRTDNAIEKLVFSLDATDMNQALRSTVISLSFDGQNTVWIPAGEFFGSGYTLQPHSTWMNRSDGNGSMECYWIMPFHNNFTLTVLNYAPDSVDITGDVYFRPYDWKPNSMYFGAGWHEYRDISTRNEGGSFFDISFTHINGKGVYAGDQITLFNPTYEWWGEGDEKFFIDGETFPSIFGTGTEDYYGYSFGRPDPYSHPFLSQPVGIGNSRAGITVNMRHRSLDAIPFNSSIRADIELWHWAHVNMDYGLVSYFYNMPSSVVKPAKYPSGVQLPVRPLTSQSEGRSLTK